MRLVWAGFVVVRLFLGGFHCRAPACMYPHHGEKLLLNPFPAPLCGIDKGCLVVYTVYAVYIHYIGVGRVDIIISNADGRPIYEQIYTQIKNQIISGALSEGEMLPSIRALAKDLRISVITTKRAYDELERDGYIYTVAAKGCFVASKNTELLREEMLKRMEDHMRQVWELAPACGLSEEEVIDMFRMIRKEETL